MSNSSKTKVLWSGLCYCVSQCDIFQVLINLLVCWPKHVFDIATGFSFNLFVCFCFLFNIVDFSLKHKYHN